MDLWIVFVIGLLGGVAVGIQSPIAGAMAQKIGGTASSFVIHLSGAILSGILLVAQGGEKIKEWHSLPWYMLAAGLWGLVLYLTINVTLPRLGSTMMVVLIIIGQLAAGVIIDHFGLLGVPVRQIDLSRVLGLAALVIGGFLIAK
jgi:bacterial/archaeal transporter family-2 protein